MLDRGLFVGSKATSGKYIRHHDDNRDQKSESELRRKFRDAGG